jgi:hypothetical protein
MGLFNKEQNVVSKHQLKSDDTFRANLTKLINGDAI